MMARLAFVLGCRLMAAAVALAAVAGTVAEAAAQERRLSFIRDAEIEHTIRTFAEPIARTAGINPAAMDYYLVADRSMNAFVAGGQNMFLNTGTLVEAQDAAELIGVMAHEFGHVAGGHLVRGQDQLDRARRTALLSTLLGVAAAVAAGSSGAGAAVVAGGQGMAQRNFLAYTRQMETAADQAAVTYLDRVGITSEGLLAFMQRLEDQELLPESAQVEYVLTHPLTSSRIDFLENHVANSPRTGAPLPAGWPDLFARSRAKLIGFMEPQRAMQLYPATATDIPSYYGHTIALYRRGDFPGALARMDRLIDAEPQNPYFHELKGQMLLETGRAAEARPHYQRAADLAPDQPLILIALAQTKIQAGGRADLDSAIEDLRRATDRPGGASPLAWRLLATAYGRTDRMGLAAVALAEEALVHGDREQAVAQARRALDLLPAGSPGHLRARDIEAVADR
jgi:predicted Zn-dependent protease